MRMHTPKQMKMSLGDASAARNTRLRVFFFIKSLSKLVNISNMDLTIVIDVKYYKKCTIVVRCAY